MLGDTDTTHGRSAYIDDSHYAAIETPGQTAIQHDNGHDADLISSPTGYIVSGDQLGVTKFFPETFGQPVNGKAPAFCADCTFIKWGAWGATAGFKDHGSEEDASQHDVNVTSSRLVGRR